jgi:hypothetical protein
MQSSYSATEKDIARIPFFEKHLLDSVPMIHPPATSFFGADPRALPPLGGLLDIR